jgi:hypothetical protein
MNTDDLLSEQDLKRHPTKPGWTMPKSFGVWELPDASNGKKYHWGNFPGKGLELDREFGSNKRIALYASRKQAKAHVEELNSNINNL